MGISLICDLDDSCEGQTLGYNAEADFTLSALGDGDLDMPAMNQQEGTLTTIDKRVVPMNVALEYGGYVLNDIASALGLNAEYTIDYTQLLPQESGFEALAFDDLPNYFDAVGTEHRGYLLKPQKKIAILRDYEHSHHIPLLHLTFPQFFQIFFCCLENHFLNTRVHLQTKNLKY